MRRPGNNQNRYKSGNTNGAGPTYIPGQTGSRGVYGNDYSQLKTQFNTQQPPVGGDPDGDGRKRLNPVALILIGAVLLIGIAVAVFVISGRSNTPIDPDTTPGPNASNAQKRAYVQQFEGCYAHNIFIDGIDIGGKTIAQVQQIMNEHINQVGSGWSLKLTYQGHEFIELTDSLIGIHFDVDQITKVLNEAYTIGHSGDIEKDYEDLMSLNETPRELYTAKSSVDAELIRSYLTQIADNIAKAPSDAYLASFNPNLPDPFNIVEEVYGVSLDVERCLNEIIEMASAGRSGTYILNPDYIQPAVTTVDIRKTVTLLATGTTPVNSASTENRTNNIRVAFSKINGLILNDGKNFSFNSVVGKRTTKNGFLEAPAYVDNETVMEVGGGVCQASSTLYAAVVCANLKVTHREPHSMAVNYCDFGFDATVNGEGHVIDFTFQNNSGGKIYITAHVESTNTRKQPYKCVIRIFGPAFEEGVSYKMRSEEIETIIGSEQPPVYKREDGTHGLTYTDELYMVKEAVDGHIVVTYRQKLLNGTVIEETKISEDTYPAQPAVYYRGTKQR